MRATSSRQHVADDNVALANAFVARTVVVAVAAPVDCA